MMLFRVESFLAKLKISSLRHNRQKIILTIFCRKNWVTWIWVKKNILAALLWTEISKWKMVHGTWYMQIVCFYFSAEVIGLNCISTTRNDIQFHLFNILWHLIFSKFSTVFHYVYFHYVWFKKCYSSSVQMIRTLQQLKSKSTIFPFSVCRMLS